MKINIDRLKTLNKTKIYRISFKVKENTLEYKKNLGIPMLSIIEKNKKVEKVIPTKVEVDNSKLISLTFDDAPSIYTEEILNVLNKNKARATFFVIGNRIHGNESLIKKINSFGNEIGIHGYSHTAFTEMEVEDVDAEIAATYSMLNDLNVAPTNIVRPPYGKLNETIKEEVASPFVLWNIDATGSDAINKILSAKEGSIIKLHDDIRTIKLLEEVLPKLNENGYKVVTISEMNKRYSNSLLPGRVYAKIKEYVA